MTKELIAIVDGREMGRVTCANTGKLSFIYTESWRNGPDSYPLSLSMPVTLAEHGNAKIDPFLWGLLPDNEKVVAQWARRFQVSARNAFGLIAAVGEDCAGAVQFVRPERLELILGNAPLEIEWLDEAGIAARLRALRADHSAWRIPRDTGQFSLAGAQPKTTLLLENGRWGVPSGRIPTTHIFKPPTTEFDGHAENEHFCLELGRALGLPVADSRIMRFEDEIAIVVERYDRVRTDARLRRVHQEDMCQAFAISPTRKYQNEGGPGITDIVGLLDANSTSATEDTATFIDSIAYNWLIGGSDAHAKNYALLIGEARVRLAPLYDVASILPYKDIDIQRVTLSMKLGGEYKLRNIGSYHWRKQADDLHLNADAMIEHVDHMAVQLVEHVSDVRRQMTDEGVTHPIVARLTDQLTERVAQCRKILATK